MGRDAKQEIRCIRRPVQLVDRGKEFLLAAFGGVVAMTLMDLRRSGGLACVEEGWVGGPIGAGPGPRSRGGKKHVGGRCVGTHGGREGSTRD